MTDADDLPDGWAVATGRDLFDFVRGVSFKKEDAKDSPAEGDVAILRAGNLQDGRILLDDLVYVTKDHVADHQQLRAGDLVIAMSSGSASVVGKVAVVESVVQNVSYGAFCGLIRPRSPEVAGWLRHYFQTQSYRQHISDQSAGVNINNLRAEHLLSLEIPLPPLTEQRRIVAKVEELTARSRAARAAFAEVPTLLEQFRQSVLASAFRGDLTADWRAKNPNAEPASVLLDRIRAERRKQFETKYPKKKYVAPEPVDDSDLPELPEGWCWAGFNECTWEITVGHVGSMKDRYVADGVRFLRSQNVRPMRFDPAGLVYIPAAFDSELKKSRLHGGEILIVRSGANVGDCCVYPQDSGPANCSDLVISRPLAGLLPEFGALFINTPEAQAALGLRTVGNAQAHFNIGAMKTTAFPLAPLEEQREVVRRLEMHGRLCHSLAAEMWCAIDDAADLDQSILAKAFRGELVPQDPADEPASDLLKRIRQQQDSGTNGTASAPKRRRTTSK